MRRAEVDELHSDRILQQINRSLNGSFSEEWGESRIEINNGIGKGRIHSIDFDWGVSLIDYDVQFNEDFCISTKVGKETPLVFFYITEGHLKYCCDDEGEMLKLDQYQNIIISNKKYSETTLVFPKGKRVQVNFIQIIKKDYLQKKNNNFSYLNQTLLPVVKDQNSNFLYYHLGNYSVQIADQIKQLKDKSHEKGIIRSLSLEAQLNLVLAMQLTEHQNYVNKISLPSSLSVSDIKKIYGLKEFIEKNAAEAITVTMLSEEAGISTKKLQQGFQILYNKSVNVHIRDSKLSMAENMLRTTDLSISEIVYNIGFKSRSYFSKIFSNKYDILPTEYRKKNRLEE